MITPTVSIVVPMFNGERFLSQTVNSILAQSFRDWELVLIDDGSKDGSADIATNYASNDERIRFVTQPNGGVANARNSGLKTTNSESEFVIFLDQDDTWEPDALADLISAIQSTPSAVAAFGIAQYVDDNGERIREGELEGALRDRLVFEKGKVRNLRIDEPSIFASLVICNQMVTPGLILMKREPLMKVGDFDQTVAPADDYDLYARMSRHGCIVFLDKLVLNYRLHSANASWSSNIRYATGLVRKKLASSSENSSEQKILANKAYRAWHLYQIVNKPKYAWRCIKQGQLKIAMGQLYYTGLAVVKFVKNFK